MTEYDLDELALPIAQATGHPLRTVRQILLAVDRETDHTLTPKRQGPARIRCIRCKQVKDRDHYPKGGRVRTCLICLDPPPAPAPDERMSSTSIRAVSGGLPGLGKRR